MAKLNFDEYIVDIMESISSKLGNNLEISTIRWVPRPAITENVADATMAFFIDGKKFEDDMVVLISNSRFPNVVKEDIDRAQRVARLVSPDIRHHIISPVMMGTYGTQTYAAFRRLEPMSNIKLVRIPQKVHFSPRVTDWSASLGLQTRRSQVKPSDFSRHFIEPLQSIFDDRNAPSAFKEFSGLCLEFVSKPNRELFTVVEHGDFWIGNVLFERMLVPGAGALLGDFFVIDWRGAHVDGYPSADIVRFCSSIYRVGSKQNDMILKNYRKVLDIEPFEIGLYSTLSLGRLGMDLDQFPQDRYYTLCQTVFRFLDAHGCTRYN